MADEKLMPRSFRLSDETVEKFKDVVKDLGGNQETALARLLESYEIQGTKLVLPDKRESIESFELHMNLLSRMYMDALMDASTMHETVRGEFDLLLRSKDETIIELQKKEAASRAKAEAAVEQLRFEKDRRTDAETRLEKETAEWSERAAAMQQDIESLTSDMAKLQQTYDALLEADQATRKQLDTSLLDNARLTEQASRMHEEVNGILKQLDDSRAVLESCKREKVFLQSLLDKTKTDCEEQISQLKDQHKAELELALRKQEVEMKHAAYEELVRTVTPLQAELARLRSPSESAE